MTIRTDIGTIYTKELQRGFEAYYYYHAGSKIVKHGDTEGQAVARVATAICRKLSLRMDEIKFDVEGSGKDTRNGKTKDKA